MNLSTSMPMTIQPTRQMIAFVVAVAVVVAMTPNFVNFENSTSFALQNESFTIRIPDLDVLVFV